MTRYSGLPGLSTAPGSFAAGILVSLSRETAWVRESIESFHVFFVELFFVAIGLLIDRAYIGDDFFKISI